MIGMADRKTENNAISEPQKSNIVDFDPPKKPKNNSYVIACAVSASMTSVLLGYDFGVISGAILYIKEDLKITDVQVEILVGILNLYCLIGSFAAGRTSDWIGRRYTIVVAQAIFFAGAILMGFATSYAFLMVGRFVAGIAVGYGLMVAPVYTAEISPTSSRGFLTSFTEVFINGGILLGYVSNYAFSKLPTHLGWRMMLGAGAIPAIIIGLLALGMPESPRWLVMQGRLGDAKLVLDKISDSKEEAEIRLAGIKRVAGISEDCIDNVVPVPKQSDGKYLWKDLILHPTPSVRHALIAAVGIHFFQQVSGIASIVLYSPRIFEKAGITSTNDKLLATVAVGFAKTMFILVGTFLLDKIGRRPLLLSSITGMIISLATLGIGLTIIEKSDQKLMWAVALCIAMVLAYVSFFSIGVGPVTWVYSSEILPLRLRSHGVSIAVAVSRLTSAVISMTFLSLGKWITTDFGVISGAIIYIKEDLKITDVEVEILVGILNLHCLIGSFAAGRTSDWIGRRYTIMVAQVIFFVGAILMGLATNYAFLMVGRFVVGVAVGFGLMIAPVYTAEVSPASSRGFLTSFTEVFINGGILLGYVSNYAFSKLPTHLGWRLMLGAGAIPAVIIGLVVLALPESPRWLVMQGRLGDAKQVLAKISASKEEAEIRLADIKRVAGISEDCTDDVVLVPKQNHGEDVWKDLVLHPTASVRHALIAAVGIHFFQQSSGIDSVVLYSPRIFEKAGITSTNDKLLATVAVGFTKTIFILVATFLLDRIGRRPLLLTSVAGMILSLATLAIGLTIIDHSDQKLTWAVALCIAMVLAYVAIYSIGLGPITWVYSSEILPLRLRAQGVSIGVAVSRLTSAAISMTFLTLSKGITIGGAFFLYASIATLSWFFFYFMLPETQDRTLEGMEGLFGNFGWKLAKFRKKNDEVT